MPEHLPTSRYFQLEVLAPGVFAAMIHKGTGAWASTGIIDLGDRTVIFDTFAVPAAAEDLRRAAVALTGRTQIDYVINSHPHSDHFRGNLAFPDATIVATHRTRELMIAETGTAEEERQGIEAGIRNRAERLPVEQDAAKRRGFVYGLSEAEAVLAAADTFRFVPPSLCFADRLTFQGSQRTAELVCPGGGHTESDAYLYLPAEGILFAGDLVAVQFHPVIGYSGAEWLRILDQLEALPIQRIVPGHGPLGTAADLAAMRAYITDMDHLVRDLIERGVAADAYADVPVLPQYADWEAANVADWNLHMVAEQIRNQS